MKLKSVKSIMNLSKRAIVMAINDQFRRMSKKQVAMIYYGLLKSKLPRLKVIKRKALPIKPKPFKYIPVRRTLPARDKKGRFQKKRRR